MNSRLGQQLGNYRLIQLLGRGGFATVYLGEHVHLQSYAALKVLPTVLTDEQRAAFVKEGQMLARLTHPHIIRILDFAVEGDIPFLVMEYAPQGTLRQRHPPESRLPLNTIVDYVRQVASALQYAHKQGLVHRDVKPENMLLSTHNEVLLSDFGLATLVPPTWSASTREMELSIQGTIPYLAPEQLQGKPRRASDQYALGIVVYEWLCGRRPFSGLPLEIAMQHLSTPAPPLREQIPDLLPALEEVVLRALAKEPELRFASIQDFAIALEHACQSTYATGPILPAPLAHPATSQTEPPRLDSAFSSLWNVPYRRNPFFTGREGLLTSLHGYLTTRRTAALTQSQALTGLGGIGKTQTAVEYAYRHRTTYQAVFWVRAASQDTLIADYVTIAELLQLPEQHEQDQQVVVKALKRWLAHHQGWLLILDNADDLSLVADFLPAGGEGHILLTTHMQATGRIAHSIPVEKMDTEEGSLLLLRRAKLLTLGALLDTVAAAIRAQAQAIVSAMDGLPLALEQAGAYIEETGCSLAEYLELYQRRRSNLLARRSSLSPDYPHTVASTWSLSFQQVEQAHPAAADLLRLCAFLDPDFIQEVIITEGATALGPVLEAVIADPFLLHEAVQVLRTFSLIKRDPEAKALSIHRLVQVVLKDGMEEQTRRQWAERAVYAVNAAFPEVAFATWGRCQQCLPHAHVCVQLIEQYQLIFPEAARLLTRMGVYLRERGQYVSAEAPLRHALLLREQLLGPEHLDTAQTLNDLATLYWSQGKYEQAEPLYQRALTIKEEHLGPTHPDTAQTLNDLAALYWSQGKYEQAEPLYQRALAICEEQLGPTHPDTAQTLNNLAVLYRQWGKYDQAEPLYQRVLAICEEQLGPTHPNTAVSLNNLARLYQSQSKYEQAEPLFQRALTIREEQLGPTHPDTAVSLNNLALLYASQGKYDQAEPLYQRALAIKEEQLGPLHPSTATSLNNLARLYQSQGKYEQAEPLYQRALAIRKHVLGPEHPDTAVVLQNYNELRQKMQ